MAATHGTIVISKKDPLGNGEVAVPCSIIVDDSNSIDLISFDVVNQLGLVDQIKASDITSLEEAVPAMRGDIKGTVKTKFRFLEDVVGIAPTFKKHYWRTLYVPEDTDCNFEVSLCRATATLLGWDIPKHLDMGEGPTVAPPRPKSSLISRHSLSYTVYGSIATTYLTRASTVNNIRE